jgi:hypothetical protein
VKECTLSSKGAAGKGSEEEGAGVLASGDRANGDRRERGRAGQGAGRGSTRALSAAGETGICGSRAGARAASHAGQGGKAVEAGRRSALASFLVLKSHFLALPFSVAQEQYNRLGITVIYRKGGYICLTLRSNDSEQA